MAEESQQTTTSVIEYHLAGIAGGKIISDGGTAALLVFDIGNGKQAVVHASIEDAPEKEEPEPKPEALAETEQQEAATETSESESAAE